MKNILIIEDDRMLNKGVAFALKKEGYNTMCAYTKEEGKKLIQQNEVDFLLLDIGLPDGSGLDLCNEIKEKMDFPIVFFTANDTEEDMLNGYDVGCDDYISKPFSIDVLRRKVSAILKRTITETAQIQYKDLEVDIGKCLVLLKGEEVHLSATEYKLLCYLIQHKGTVVTKAMLLENLWDKDGNFIDDNTLRVNIKRLTQKLKDDNQEYIVTVFGIGYTFGE